VFQHDRGRPGRPGSRFLEPVGGTVHQWRTSLDGRWQCAQRQLQHRPRRYSPTEHADRWGSRHELLTDKPVVTALPQPEGCGRVVPFPSSPRCDLMRCVMTATLIVALAALAAGCGSNKSFDGPTVDSFTGRVVKDGKPVSLPTGESIQLKVIHEKTAQ